MLVFEFNLVMKDTAQILPKTSHSIARQLIISFPKHINKIRGDTL